MPKFSAEKLETLLQHPAWCRLEDQIAWYEEKSKRCQTFYKVLKFLQIAFASLIPFIHLIGIPYDKLVVSFIAVLIAVFEGIQHMNQYSMLWISYRACAEGLKREKSLFLSVAGPYRNLDDDQSMATLCEHVEQLISNERTHWSSITDDSIQAQQK